MTTRQAIRAEWIKFRGLRASMVLSLTAFGMILGFGSLAASVLGNAQRTQRFPASRYVEVASTGTTVAVLFVGALAVLFVSSEWASGSIRTTLAALPGRRMFLVSKAVVAAVVGALATALGGVASSLAAAAMVGAGAQHPVGPTAPGSAALFAAMGTVGALTALIGVGLGAATRSTVGGVMALISLFMVAPLLFALVPVGLAADLSRYLPLNAAAQFLTPGNDPNGLDRVTSLLVLLGWTVFFLRTGSARLERDDV